MYFKDRRPRAAGQDTLILIYQTSIGHGRGAPGGGTEQGARQEGEQGFCPAGPADGLEGGGASKVLCMQHEVTPLFSFL